MIDYRLNFIMLPEKRLRLDENVGENSDLQNTNMYGFGITLFLLSSSFIIIIFIYYLSNKFKIEFISIND